MKFFFKSTWLIAFLVLSVSPILGVGVLHQVSTFSCLNEGGFAGVKAVKNLQKAGNFGLGAFSDIDGEMVFDNGVVYRVYVTGQVVKAQAEDTVCFAMVASFNPAVQFTMANQSLDLTQLGLILTTLRKQDQKPKPMAIRITGTFSRLTLRSVPKQKQPYPVLKTVLEQQKTWPLENVSGILVGFWCPDSASGISIPGYHFHFISNNGQIGGHVLAAQFKEGTLSYQELDRLYLEW